MAAAQDSAVRVRLRYGDTATFVDKFAPNVTRGGIFLASRSPRPVGEVLRFEVLLSDGKVVLSGEGRVTWVRDFNPAEPHKPHGMGVQFLFVDPETRPVLEQLLARKEPVRRPTSPTGQPVTAAPSPQHVRRPTGPVPVEAFDEGVDDAAIRRAMDRARVLSSRTDDLDALLTREQDEPATLSQALAELPRLLSGPSRRPTGTFRPLDEAPRTEPARTEPDASQTAEAPALTGEHG